MDTVLRINTVEIITINNGRKNLTIQQAPDE
jgi:hypothetical protein